MIGASTSLAPIFFFLLDADVVLHAAGDLFADRRESSLATLAGEHGDRASDQSVAGRAPCADCERWSET